MIAPYSMIPSRTLLTTDAITSDWFPCKGAALVDVLVKSGGIGRTAKGTGFVAGSATLTIPNVSIAAGASVVVGVSTDSAVTISSVTWNGLALTADITGPATNGQRGTIYSRHANAAATGSVVVTFSGSSTAAAAWVSEYRGISAIDKTAAAEGTSTTPSSGATAATAVKGELLVGHVAIDGIVADSIGLWSNSFTQGQRDGGTGALADEGFRIVNATGAYTAAKTGISSRAWQAMIATYQAQAPLTATIELARVTGTAASGGIGGVLISQPDLQLVGVEGGTFGIIRPDGSLNIITTLMAEAFRVIVEGGTVNIPGFEVIGTVHGPWR